MKTNQYAKIFFFILLIILAGLACNLPGYEQNQPEKDETAPTSTDDASSSPQGSLPDLVVDSITIESTTIVLESTPWTWITFQVTNIGNAPTSDVVQAAMHLNGEKFGGYFELEGVPLQPGESASHQFAVGDKDYWPLGSHTLEVIVDYFHEIEESNEDNNTSNPITFEIVAP
jgi:hypothetical protein